MLDSSAAIVPRQSAITPPTGAPAVVLVGHGAAGAASGTSIRALADRLVDRGDCGAVEVAFLSGQPSLAAVLARLACASEICVVPLLAGEGHFTQTTLAEMLRDASDRRSTGDPVRQAPALGSHPWFTTFLAGHLHRLVAEAGIDRTGSAFLAIGHGSRRTAGRADAAVRLADAMRSDFAVSLALHLDSEPFAASWPALIAARDIVVAPVFFSDGRHARVDVPRLFGFDREAPNDAQRLLGPWPHLGRRVWYATIPIACDAVADIVVRIVRSGARASMRRPAARTDRQRGLAAGEAP